MTNLRTVHRVCPFCEATCGLAITVEGDQIRTVRGDPDDPFSRGFLCPKAAQTRGVTTGQTASRSGWLVVASRAGPFTAPLMNSDTHAVESRVSVHDFHTTIMHLLGLNHEELVYNHHGL